MYGKVFRIFYLIACKKQQNDNNVSVHFDYDNVYYNVE